MTNCDSGWGFMRKWNLEPSDYSSSKGETFTMTLSSHRGQALVMSNRSEQFWGHEVNYYEVGDASRAVKFYFSKYATGYLIRLDSNRRKGMDVAFNKLQEGTEVVSWLSHKGRNQ